MRKRSNTRAPWSTISDSVRIELSISIVSGPNATSPATQIKRAKRRRARILGEGAQMSAHFCLAIGLLDRTFHGCLDRGDCEWPPSPARAYQALVAAAGGRACGGPLPDAVRGALEWLERQP